MKPARRVEIAAEGIRGPLPWSGRLARFCSLALGAAGCRRWDVAVLLCRDERMAELNGRYRGKRGPTDVLSFPREPTRGSPASRPRAAAEGDIAISVDTMRRNAASYGCTRDEELKRLAVHGLLHLAGMDHGPGRSGPMLDLQERILLRLQGRRIVGGRGT